MKRLPGYALLILTILIVADWICSRPDPRWADVTSGMSEDEVLSVIGIPSTDVLHTKGIQIWNHPGFIRSTSLAVIYEGSERPAIASKVLPGQRWLWERL